MKALAIGCAVAATLAAAAAGLRGIQNGLVALPIGGSAQTEQKSVPSGPIIYYRDPDGNPFFSAAPRRSPSGSEYVPVYASEDVSFDPAKQAAEKPAKRKIKYYRNPMGLPDTSPVPKKDSMGMDYMPVFEGDDADDGSVRIPLGKQQKSSVETAVVGKRALGRTINAPGVVQLDERRVSVLAPRFEGYVVKLGPATTGTHVKKGDVLATVFGQELLNWGARLIIERGYNYRGADEAFTPPGLKSEGSGVIGARRRLENLGAPEDFVADIDKNRRVPNEISLTAPMDGVVLERNVVDGQAFKAGDVLFRIADHSKVWMMADVAEADIALLNAGQAASVIARARPGRTFKGKVAVIYPHLMKETRTARVRIELDNPDYALLPDMYGDVAIATAGPGQVVAVPISALIDNGTRRVVIKATGEGAFTPVDVKVGRIGDGFVEITQGLAEGDTIVVNGNFLIDAESNLQSALKAFETKSADEAKP